MNQNNERSKSNEALLEINYSSIKSQIELDDLNYFKIEFNLHRFVQQNKKIDNFFTFLTLRQKMTMPLSQNFYQIGVDQDGYLAIQKIQLNHDQSLNETFKVLWTLKNDKINLNQFNTSYSSLISVKLNENFVLLNVNNSHPARFKLSQNFDYLEDTHTKFEIENIIFMSNFSTGFNFLLYELAINDLLFNYRFMEPYRVELIVLDNKKKFVFKTNDLFRIRNLALINKSDFRSDLKLIESLDCPLGQLTEGYNGIPNVTTPLPKR